VSGPPVVLNCVRRRHGLVVGLVPILYPGGSAVCLIFVVLWCFVVLGPALWRRADQSFFFLGTWGEWPVLQLFLGAYGVALLITFVRVGVFQTFGRQ
jgi:hypothetical protein